MLKAVFFDKDGVTVDTQKIGHRVAFNKACREFGLRIESDADAYRELLSGGGKERFLHCFSTRPDLIDVDFHSAPRLVRSIYKRKTAISVEIIDKGFLQLHSGNLQIMEEANRAGLFLGVGTTSSKHIAAAIYNSVLSIVKVLFVLAGDLVHNKKPDPETRELALGNCWVSTGGCIVIGDSQNGVLAAKAAGINVPATAKEYTLSEDLSGADAEVSFLGDAGVETSHVRSGPLGTPSSGIVTPQDLEFVLCGAVA